MNSVIILNTLLILFASASTIYLIRDLVRNRHNFGDKSATVLSAIGLVTNFFDALGIGNYAPTTALLRLTKTCDDKNIPGTLNVGYMIPVVLEAIIFMTAIEVEPVTLISMIVAATLGAGIGAGIVSSMPVRRIRCGMGGALLIVVVMMLLQMAGIFPSGGNAIGLSGSKLILGVVINFILGALMTIGSGLYAPCMALVYALGMNPAVAFPIMMGSCAFLMPSAAIRFVKSGAYDRKATLCLCLSGIVGILIATRIVTSLPLFWLKILVAIVVTYTGVTMLRDGLRSERVQAAVMELPTSQNL